ncbi:unnamed protein product [Orchesella dallaii]
MIWEIVLVFFLAWLIRKAFSVHNVKHNGKLLPGPYKYPILGNLPQLAKESKKGKKPYVVLRELSKKYGHRMSLHFGATYQVIFDDVEAVRDVLSSDIWIDRYVDGWILERSFGKPLGVFFANGESWKELRRFSIRTLRDFGFGKFNSQETIIEEELLRLMSRMDSLITESKDSVVYMKKFFSVSALNIIWSLIAGYRFSHDDVKLQKLVQLMSDIVQKLAVGEDIITAYPALRHVIPRFTQTGKDRQDFLTAMHGFFKELLETRRAEGVYKTEQRDFIDVFLLEIDNHAHDKTENNFYTDKQFLVLALDFFLAGTETTSSTLEFAFLYILLNPRVQKKVQEEIDRVVDHSGLPSTLDRTRMPYTEATLLEVQRFATVVPLFSRSNIQDQQVGEYVIPKGTMGIVSLYSANYSEESWGDPFTFRPERFLNEKTNTLDQDVCNKVMAFGLGKRICAGEVLAKANLFKFFTSFLQRYTFEEAPNHPTPSTDPLLGTVQSPRPFYAVVKPRNRGTPK